MLIRHDPGKVLRHLADTLDIEKTLSSFPGLTRDELRSILKNSTGNHKNHPSEAILSVDGAARGNPGQAGAGIVLRTAEGAINRTGEYLGEATNNVAEYKALLLGMQKASELGIRKLLVRCDSELIVRQMNGQYKVKSPQLQDLYFSAIKAVSSFDSVTFTHVPREENKEADKMANLAIDAKKTVTL